MSCGLTEGRRGNREGWKRISPLSPVRTLKISGLLLTWTARNSELILNQFGFDLRSRASESRRLSPNDRFEGKLRPMMAKMGSPKNANRASTVRSPERVVLVDGLGQLKSRDQRVNQAGPYEIHLIPFGGEFIIYRPLRHLAFIGNHALAEYLKRKAAGDLPGHIPTDLDTFLDSIGFWKGDLKCDDLLGMGEVRPAHAVLLMTNRCNLRCVYCYADAGTSPKQEEMSWPIAQAVIDQAIANAQAPGCGPAGLTFHGGGEPALHWELLKRCVRYARERAPDCRVSMSTNGVWSQSQERFICEHFTEVSLSMDGTWAVQNSQRPFANGKGSSAAVRKTMAALDAAGVNYGVRMTVLPDSVAQLVEGVKLICEQSRAASIQVEPTFTSSRGVYSDIDPGFAEAFSSAFMDAWRFGVHAGRQVYYSGARPWVIAPAFCLAPVRAMVATPSGQLMTCFEIFTGEHSQAGVFQVGSVRNGRVEYNPTALGKFLEREAKRRAECRECFCYWHCCGDCATRRQSDPGMDSGRCQATRAITCELLAAYIAEGGGVWQGYRETN
jgi:uncharacterized protein